MRNVNDSSAKRLGWAGMVRQPLLLVGIAFFLNFTGVYGATTSLPFLWGWAYWFMTLLVGAGVGFAAVEAFKRAAPRTPSWVQIITAGILASLAVTLTLFTIQSLLGQPIPLSFAPNLFVLVAVITVALMGVGFLIDRATASRSVVETERDPIAIFLDRLPIKYRGAALYAISSEDHYLRVYTDRGEELILMRLADAVRELSGAEGLQTHRSWWVAKDGVADTVSANGKQMLVLKSGAEAPVSRTYKSAAKAAGLL